MMLLDWKSSAYRSLEEELQLGGYAGATHRWEEARWEWVRLDAPITEAGIVHVWEGGCKVETRLTRAELETAFQKFLEAKDLFDWMVTKGQVRIPENEAYRVQGWYYPSVTYILQHVIAKPNLMNWSYEMGVGAGLWVGQVGAPPLEEGVVVGHALEAKTKLDAKTLKRTDPEAQPWLRMVEWLEGAGKSANARRDSAGGQGSSLHKNILFYLQGRALSLTDLTPYLRDSLTHFMAWAQRVKLKPRYLEQKVINDELGYAGTSDFLGEAELDRTTVVKTEPTVKARKAETTADMEAI